MRLAAVVVTFNRLGQLQQTVARLLADPVDHLVVVDNGSTDGSRDWLAGQTDARLCVILPTENGGGAQGFETGLRQAVARFDPDWCVLMDDDARPEPGALAAFRAMDTSGLDAVAAAVRFPDGRICEMNRPWLNPFGSPGVLLRTLLGGGRAAFHLADADYAAPAPRPIDGGSFVGLFLSRAAVARGGYPDGRLFIYGDDVLYTLGLSRAGGRIAFAPDLRFVHDCATQAAGAIFRPLWKTYYHHRNLWFVYRMTAGPVLFPALMAVMLPKWLIKGQSLPQGERRIYRRLIRLAVRDALTRNLTRTFPEVRALAEG